MDQLIKIDADFSDWEWGEENNEIVAKLRENTARVVLDVLAESPHFGASHRPGELIFEGFEGALSVRGTLTLSLLDLAMVESAGEWLTYLERVIPIIRAINENGRIPPEWQAGNREAVAAAIDHEIVTNGILKETERC